MKTIAFASVAVLMGLWIYAGYTIATHIEHRSIVVSSKERLMKVSSDTDGKTNTTYTNFVYSGDEAYVVQDSLWNGHFRAGTVYASIHEGKTCNVTLSGFRFGFLSMYQNIIAAECASEVRP